MASENRSSAGNPAPRQVAAEPAEHPEGDFASLEGVPMDVETSCGIGTNETSSFRIPVTSDDKSNSAPAANGQMLAGFRLLSVLGEGGFGTVYRAEDTQLRRKVALKLLRPRALEMSDAQERFLGEARALAAIHHDHVVPIFAAGSEGGVIFIAMPLLAGETLASRLEREGALPAAEVRRIGQETAAGLAAIHAKGLVHRDLKPANIWLEAGSGRVKVLDLGLAHDPLTPLQELSGTPPYMSPEQAHGEPLDYRSDLFSLGAVLYECATGRRAHAGKSPAEVLRAVQEEMPTPVQLANPGVPAELAQVILRLLEKEPHNRPTSARDVEAAFATPAASEPAPASQRAPLHSWQWVALVALLAVVGSIPAIAYIASRNQPAPTKSQPTPLVVTPQPGVEPVQIESFQVNHFATIDGKNVRPRGVLGQQSFGAALGDEFNVQAKLSRPAYSYLIVYRPDGQSEVLYPQDDTDVPELTDTPHYPSKRRDERYVLEEGAGLWLVTLFVSESPLPSYQEWKTLHPDTPWKPSPGQPGTVWWDDGQLFHTLEPGNDVRGSKKTADLEPIAQLVDWLRAQGRGTTQAIGFTVK